MNWSRNYDGVTQLPFSKESQNSNESQYMVGLMPSDLQDVEPARW